MSAPPAPAGQRPGADEAEAAASAAEKVPDPEVVSEARNVISSFLRRVEVYDVMPDSAKVRSCEAVVALDAPLARNGPSAAPRGS